MIASSRRRVQLEAAVSPILAAVNGRLPSCAHGAMVLDAHRTATGMGIVVVGAERERPCVVVKLALDSAAGTRLVNEGETLSALQADERLGGWGALAPRRLASGVWSAHRYGVDTAIPGLPGHRLTGHPTALGRLNESAAEAAAELHERSAQPLAVDDAVIERWVTRPARLLAAHGASAELVRSLVGSLSAGLHGRTLTAGWVHGDLWAGNLLVGSDGTLCGIVDWDAAEPAGLPLHDVFNLMLSARRLVGGLELGAVLSRQLLKPEWTPAERRVLAAYGGDPAEGLRDRDALLLYWLHHAAAHTGQQGGTTSYRYRVWRRRNVDPVLAAQ